MSMRNKLLLGFDMGNYSQRPMCWRGIVVKCWAWDLQVKRPNPHNVFILLPFLYFFIVLKLALLLSVFKQIYVMAKHHIFRTLELLFAPVPGAFPVCHVCPVPQHPACNTGPIIRHGTGHRIQGFARGSVVSLFLLFLFLQHMVCMTILIPHG